ncbi:MAG: nucleoside phosphorylase, partial [Chitinophagales bacterium]|nr:nucleoside phosphorylase [Chitinophagales bacterium]
PDRVVEVTKYFASIELKRNKREFVTHTGYFAGKRLTVISTGIGTDNIDIVLTELDALVNIDLVRREKKNELKKLKIIRIGTSGSLQKEIEVDSFVASEFAIGIDNLMNFYEMKNSGDERKILHAFVKHVQQNQIGFIPYITTAAPNLLSVFNKDFVKGITVTCPGFYGPQGRILRAPLAYPHLIDLLTSFQFENYQLTNFEMETAGIYGMANILGHEAISLNAIVANRVENTFSPNGELAVDNLIRLALERIAEMGN